MGIEMIEKKSLSLLKRIRSASIALLAVLMVFHASASSADDKQDAMQLVEKARLAFESFMSDSKMEPMHGLMRRAKGIFIAPQILRGAFIVGASGGSGVLLVWDEEGGRWNGPAFYTMGGASFGLQIGGDASEVILLIMTDRGTSSLLSSSVKLGADAGIAVGPVGAGVSASTANLSADILSFSRSKGLYGGISLDGAVIATRGDWNKAFYGRPVTSAGILIRREVSNPQSGGLVEAIEKGAGKR